MSFAAVFSYEVDRACADAFEDLYGPTASGPAFTGTISDDGRRITGTWEKGWRGRRLGARLRHVVRKDTLSGRGEPAVEQPRRTTNVRLHGRADQR